MSVVLAVQEPPGIERQHPDSGGQGRASLWLLVLLVATCLIPGLVHASPPDTPDDTVAGVAQPADPVTASDPQAPDEPDELGMQDIPSSIAQQWRQDRESKEYLFQIPGAQRLLGPWSDLRTELDRKYGFRPNISSTHLYQWASDTVRGTPEDDASGFEFVIDGTWNFLGRDTRSPTIAGFEFLWRDKLGTDLPPAALFTQVGSLYPTAVAFGDVDPSVGALWIQQIFDQRFGFRVGKYNPVQAYDFFPFKNFRTDFLDPIHAANIIIPLPSRGLGAFGMYRPDPEVYLRVGVHDANAVTTQSGFRTLFEEKELFSIFEVGFDPGRAERPPGMPPPGDIHLSLWHQDKRDDAKVDSAWGFVVAASHPFGRFTPFLRYGYSSSDRRGPTPLDHMVNGGVAIDNIFGQKNDRIGIGLTWSHPSDHALDDQETLDVFYRIQVTPRIAVTPTLQLILDPVRNRSDDEVFVLGVRTRLAF